MKPQLPERFSAERRQTVASVSKTAPPEVQTAGMYRISSKMIKLDSGLVHNVMITEESEHRSVASPSMPKRSAISLMSQRTSSDQNFEKSDIYEQSPKALVSG